MSQRFIDYNKHSPGPQDYDYKAKNVLNKSPVFSLGNKSKSTRQIDFDHNAFKPAPTNYNTKNQWDQKNGIFVGSSTRQDLTETEKTPAPNYYMSASAADFASSANPKYKFGSNDRKTDIHHL